MKASVWRFYVCVTISMAAAYFTFETTSLSKLLLYNGIGLSGLIAVLWGIRRNQPSNRRAWFLVAGSLASFLTADIVYYVLELTSHAVPFPSIADAFYLGMYPLMIFGLFGLVRTVAPGRDGASLIDACLVAVATFAVLGILVMDTYLTDATLNLEGRLISLAYPVMDVALVAVAARLVATVRLRQASFGLMTLGLGSLMIADTIYGVLNTAGTFETGGLADAFWIGFYVLIGAAALHPSMGERVEARETSVGHITRARLAVLFGVVLTVPIIDLLWGEPFDKFLTTGASMLMFGLVLARLTGLVTIVQAKERQARHDALHDSLTGLANRVLFNERVEHYVGRSDEGLVSVLFIDLDDFKFINDSLGHHAGDRLLVVVAQRLQSCVRNNDTVARLSGDEFAILLESAVDRQDAIAVAGRVQDSLGRTVSIDDREVIVSASVGIAVDRRSKVSKADTILRAADVAMYRAKNNGKARFEMFEESMRLDAVERLDLTTDLQVALERGQFELAYQPIIDMKTGSMVSVESLLRWNHPSRGLVMPDRFIPLAEQTGLIVPIGRWVLREACNEVMRWRNKYPNAPRGVAVNLSVRQLRDPGLLEDVADALSSSGLEPESLTLEITESILIDEADRGSRTLEQLKALKVKLAIDDFGTGYSSLSYLRRFPVDTIKIDRSFVAEISPESTSESLVRAVVDLAESLKVATVAEGVETLEQHEMLVGLECGLGQGYYYARPGAAATIEDVLESTAPSVKGPAVAELESQVLDGRGELDKFVAEIGSLHTSVGAPLMARVRWADAWASVHDDWTPLTVIVKERGTSRLEAAALLAFRRGADGHHEVVSMGSSSPGCTRLPSLNDRASKLLSRGIKDRLSELGQWTLRLQQLPEGDPVATLLARQLPNAELVPDLWVPVVDFGSEPTINDFLSRNTRKQIRRAKNRIAGDGHTAKVTVATSEIEVIEVLQRVEAIHVGRDHDAGRESDLDDPKALELWRRIIMAHAAAGSLELSMFLIDEEIAAYVIGFVDDDEYRVFDGHFASEFARYSPGRIIEAAVLERAMSDTRMKGLDWMAGVGSEKILASNATVGRMQLVASTTAGVTLAQPSDNISVTAVDDDGTEPEREPALVRPLDVTDDRT